MKSTVIGIMPLSPCCVGPPSVRVWVMRCSLGVSASGRYGSAEKRSRRATGRRCAPHPYGDRIFLFARATRVDAARSDFRMLRDEALNQPSGNLLDMLYLCQ